MDKEGLREGLAKANASIADISERKTREVERIRLREEERAPAYEVMDGYLRLWESTKTRLSDLIANSPTYAIEVDKLRTYYHPASKIMESATLSLGVIDAGDSNGRTHLYAYLAHDQVVERQKYLFNKYRELSPRQTKVLGVSFHAGPADSETNHEQWLEIKNQNAKHDVVMYLQKDFDRGYYADELLDVKSDPRRFMESSLSDIQSVAEALDFIEENMATKNSLQTSQ